MAKKPEKPKESKFRFLRMPEQNYRKTRRQWKEGMLSCCKCLFEQIGVNLGHFQPENVQNMRFWQKGLGVNG